jgi:hypothetical protein
MGSHFQIIVIPNVKSRILAGTYDWVDKKKKRTLGVLHMLRRRNYTYPTSNLL